LKPEILRSPILISLQNSDLYFETLHFHHIHFINTCVVCLKRLYLFFFQYPLRHCILLSQVSCAIPKIRLCSFKDVHSQGSCNFLDGIQHLFYVFQPFYLYPSTSVSVLVYIVTWFAFFPFVFSRCTAVVFHPYRVQGLVWRVYDFSRIFVYSLFYRNISCDYILITNFCALIIIYS